jgi:FlaA1/EpsC-like NDP-sugar epimerase
LRNRYFLLLDMVTLPLAACLAYLLRLEGIDLALYGGGLALFTSLVLIATLVAFSSTGVYSRYWRYASVEEGLLLAGNLLMVVFVAGVITLLAAPWLPGGGGFPRSIPVIFFFLGLTVTATPRFAMRLAARTGSGFRDKANGNGRPLQPVLVMGAGDAGALIVRELQNNPHLGLDPVGFLDDDLAKHDAHIHGVPVLGARSDIHETVRKFNVTQVIIAMPTAPGKAIREIVRECEAEGIRTRIIPGIYELLGGTVSVNQLRPVQIEDLLRREPVETDIGQVAALLRGRRVLVTGAGGSIGSELCRQISQSDPAEVVLLGHGENSIFEITNLLRRDIGRAGQRPVKEQGAATRPIYHPVIADVRDADRIRAVVAHYRPEIVFHAAAHKHVPLMETNVEDAITNNVAGTRCLVDACLAAEVGQFIFISTDKAVNPTSVMGATKRVAELIVQQAAQQSGRCYVAVRFGNVLGSRGSVVPFFQRQIAAGGPVTVTHPDVRRYFMTIPEAVQLVLQAAALGRGGEIFVLDMGDPIRIEDLAKDLVRLSGLEPGRDIDIVYSGLRPGEKLFEELFAEQEAYARTQHQKVFVCHNGNGGPAAWQGTLERGVEALLTAAKQGDGQDARRLLSELVPGFPIAVAGPGDAAGQHSWPKGPVKEPVKEPVKGPVKDNPTGSGPGSGMEIQDREAG